MVSIVRRLMCHAQIGNLTAFVALQVVGLARDPRYGERLQEKAYTSTLDAMKRILKKEGWAGLFKGTLPSVVKSAPSSATTFLVYEFLSSRLERGLQ